jgi:hypothetical protein
VKTDLNHGQIERGRLINTVPINETLRDGFQDLAFEDMYD